MKIHFIASGSKGNATLIIGTKTIILIDCGISKRRLEAHLKEFNCGIKNIDYVFFTHNHIDHIKGIKNIPIEKRYGRRGAIDELLEENSLEVWKEYSFNEFKITPLLTSHDAPSPCGYLIKDEESETVYITDTGYIPKETLQLIKNKTNYVIESNHDINMLIESDRSVELKERILSFEGHLSNEMCAMYLALLVENNTKNIFCAHVSLECNKQDIVKEEIKNAFNKFDIDSSKINLYVLNQWEDLTI